MARALLVLLVVPMLAVSAAAQNAAEFGRASGGAIDAITKTPRQMSGSLSLTRSAGAFQGLGYEATLGGELLNDRLWFFGTALTRPGTQFSGSELSAIDTKATAQPADWTNISASFRQLRQPDLATPIQPNDGTLPMSFLSLRSTSILSDRMTVDFRVSMQR